MSSRNRNNVLKAAGNYNLNDPLWTDMWYLVSDNFCSEATMLSIFILVMHSGIFIGIRN